MFISLSLGVKTLPDPLQAFVCVVCLEGSHILVEFRLVKYQRLQQHVKGLSCSTTPVTHLFSAIYRGELTSLITGSGAHLVVIFLAEKRYVCQALVQREYPYGILAKSVFFVEF